MEVKEVELRIEKLTKTFKIRKVKEKWNVVKFGDKEFIMTKDSADYFVRRISKDALFHLYFDGSNTILEECNDPIFRRCLKGSGTILEDLFVLNDTCFPRIPVGTNRESVKKYRFIAVDENAEFYRPENYDLIAKENGIALYTTNNDNDKILYRNGKEYTIFFRYEGSERFHGQTVIFDTEKPLNEEIFNLIKRLHHKNENNAVRYISYDYAREFEIGIIDDVDVYVGKNHYILALENAEVVRVIENSDSEKLIAIKGNKTYIELKRNRQTEDERNWHKDKDGVYYIPYTSRYRIFDYEINPINVLKVDEYDTVIAQLPNLDTEIKVKKFIKKVEPVLVDTRNEYWDYIPSEPELVEEKTYKLRELVRKLDDKDKKPSAKDYRKDYRVDIELPTHA